MKKIITLFAIVLLTITAVTMTSCTEQERAKSWGGEMTVTLQPNQKLVNVTWKENNMWILTTPMTSDDTAVVYEFVESSNYGLMEGKITIVESR